MLIENVMYFVLGALASALLALVVLPAVWRRAVRLTKRRIEAATPMTMSEFRADKDQLRAEFALSTRRLEMTIEQLRTRLAEQQAEMAARRDDLAAIATERQTHAAVLREFEEREAAQGQRLLELETETADLVQRLRMREREIAERTGEIDKLRQALRGDLVPDGQNLEGEALTGDYDDDIDRLTTALAVERKRTEFLSDQARSLIARLERSGRRGTETTAAIAEMRAALNGNGGESEKSDPELVAAEAKIASAEHRLNALLAETDTVGRAERLLAEQLNLDEQVTALRAKVGSVEMTILADWGTARADTDLLRARFNEIATTVSRIVYTTEGGEAGEPEESLFDRVQRFSDDGRGFETLPLPAAPSRPPRTGKLGERVAALSELQSR
jgi:chromosome segregation ATPase